MISHGYRRSERRSWAASGHGRPQPAAADTAGVRWEPATGGRRGAVRALAAAFEGAPAYRRPPRVGGRGPGADYTVATRQLYADNLDIQISRLVKAHIKEYLQEIVGYRFYEFQRFFGPFLTVYVMFRHV